MQYSYVNPTLPSSTKPLTFPCAMSLKGRKTQFLNCDAWWHDVKISLPEIFFSCAFWHNLMMWSWLAQNSLFSLSHWTAIRVSVNKGFLLRTSCHRAAIGDFSFSPCIVSQKNRAYPFRATIRRLAHILKVWPPTVQAERREVSLSKRGKEITRLKCAWNRYVHLFKEVSEWRSLLLF